MELVRWNPNRRFVRLNSDFDRVFDNFFTPFSGLRRKIDPEKWTPKVDVYDDKDNIILKAELPGIDKKDIDVDVDDGVLTIKGSRSSEETVEKEKYFRQERCYGTFERSFTLPDDTNPELISADYKDGVLKVTIVKPEKSKPKAVKVNLN